MNDFRNRPKDNYINEADWQKLYILTEHWKSDLKFYKADLWFLHHLIKNYFMWLTKDENIETVKAIDVNLLKVETQCRLLLDRTHKHLHHLAELMDNPFAYDSHKFRAEHEILEDDLVQFIKDFRKNRKEVFKISEHIIEGEELVRQLHITAE